MNAIYCLPAGTSSEMKMSLGTVLQNNLSKHTEVLTFLKLHWKPRESQKTRGPLRIAAFYPAFSPLSVLVCVELPTFQLLLLGNMAVSLF